MTVGLKIWRVATKPLFRFFDKIAAHREQKNLQRSFARPVVECCSRDSFKYYEKGRWTMVSGELMSGGTGVDRILYRRCPMKWNDTAEPLTEAERERVFQAVGEHLDKSKVRWEFNDAAAPGWK
jgi:hypothetical protein